MAAEKDATLEQAAQQAKNDWVKAGSTPAPTPPAPPAPPPPPAAEPAPATVQTRGPDGKFGPKSTPDAVPPGHQPIAPKPPTPAPAAPPAPPAPGASAAEIQDFIEAQLGEQNEPFKIPRGVRLPQKRGDVVEYEPLEEILKRGMMGKDYNIKTQGINARIRELEDREADLEARIAQSAAREAYLTEQETMLREANTSQEGYETFQAHLRAMETNPRYKKFVEDALAKRETDARLETYETREQIRQRDAAVDAVIGWIEDIAADYPGVDPGRVREIYAAGLRQEIVPLDRAEVERIFKAEAQHLSKSLTPLQQEVAELRAQVAALTGAQTDAQRHNAQTAHAVQRGGAVPTQPPGGSPPAPAAPGPVAPFTLRELPDKNREWANRR